MSFELFHDYFIQLNLLQMCFCFAIPGYHCVFGSFFTGMHCAGAKQGAKSRHGQVLECWTLDYDLWTQDETSPKDDSTENMFMHLGGPCRFAE